MLRLRLRRYLDAVSNPWPLMDWAGLEEKKPCMAACTHQRLKCVENMSVHSQKDHLWGGQMLHMTTKFSKKSHKNYHFILGYYPGIKVCLERLIPKMRIIYPRANLSLG